MWLELIQINSVTKIGVLHEEIANPIPIPLKYIFIFWLLLLIFVFILLLLRGTRLSKLNPIYIITNAEIIGIPLKNFEYVFANKVAIKPKVVKLEILPKQKKNKFLIYLFDWIAGFPQKYIQYK